MFFSKLKAIHIGSLVKVKAVVTRVSEVKPKIIYATYSCMQCGAETVQEVFNFWVP